VTLNWVSPVHADEAQNAGRTVTTLLESTDQAWERSELDIQPDMVAYPDYGFPVGDERGQEPLAVSVIGSFDSFFAGKEIPTPEPDSTQTGNPPLGGTIAKSPDTARLTVIGSGNFVDDTVIQISSQLSADRYLNSLQFVQNSIDWSVEDLDLLAIRSRGASTRLLTPLTRDEQTGWEFANYGFALLALVLIGLWWSSRRRAERPMQLSGDVQTNVDQEVTLEHH
jgi:ABC-2 type transport system permease protein